MTDESTAMAPDRAPEAPEADAPDAARPRSLRRRLLGGSWWVKGPVLLYLVLTLLGVTQSSIGIGNLRQDLFAPTPDMIGPGLSIRSDEFLTATPVLLGAAATGNSDDGNPLTARQGFFTLVPPGPVSAVVLPEGAAFLLGPVLPDQMLLAAAWWLPYLLLALGAPAYFRSLTGSREIGLFAALLVVVSPASAWWSATPVEIIGFTMAGSAALLRCRELVAARRVAPAVAWGLAAAILLARIPLHYQPWSVVLAVAILAVAAVPTVLDRVDRRSGLLAVGGVGAVAAALAAGTILENIEGVRASLNTLYPGARVGVGSPNPVQEIFGGTALGNLRAQALVATNASEISSSFAVAALWAVLLLLLGVRFRDGRHRTATITAAGVTAFWFAWCLVDFGEWSGRLPVINLVPSYRAADVVGFLGVLLLCLVLPGLVRVSLRRAVLVAAVVSLVAAAAGSQLRAVNVPTLPIAAIWLSSLLLGAVVLWISAAPRRWHGYALAVVLGTLLIWNVNPVLFGLGDLRDSDVARQMLAEGAEARERGEVWASDDMYVDALLTATGVPSLSSRQIAGPDPEGWEMVDPSGAAEDVWNRGGSYIVFGWNDDPTIGLSNPQGDIIQMVTSPCTLAQRVPQLGAVIANHQLDDACLDAGTPFEWGGATHWLHRVEG